MGEATRYVARHGQPHGRVAKLVLIGAVPLLLVKTPANPGGLPIEVFDGLRKALADNRAQFYLDFASGPFYSFNRPGAKPIPGVIQNWWRQAMTGAANAHYSGIKAFSETDFTEDLKVINDRRPIMIGRFLCAAALITASMTIASAQDVSGSQAKITLVYDHVLPNVPGKSIRGVRDEHPPGGTSPAHTHPKSAFIYAVLVGAIRSQVNDGPVTTYYAGESCSELPDDRHSVSANASTAEPVRRLAVFVVDTKDKVLTTRYEK